MKDFVEKLINRLEEKLYLADEEKRKADVLQFDRKVGYAGGISSAINTVSQLAEEYNHGWILVEERLPDTDDYILLSFENSILPDIGRYEEDENGGAFYIGDDDTSCRSYGLFVNAWQKLPERYKPEETKQILTDHFTERFNRVV